MQCLAVNVHILAPANGKLVHVRAPGESWRLPGGFVPDGEDVNAFTLRAFREQVGLDLEWVGLLAANHDADRGHLDFVVTGEWFNEEFLSFDGRWERRMVPIGHPSELPRPVREAVALAMREMFIPLLADGERYFGSVVEDEVRRLMLRSAEEHDEITHESDD